MTHMKTNRKTSVTAASTYSLLVSSEEKERSLAETFVYLLLIGSAAFTMWSVAQQPFRVPVVQVGDNATVAQAASATQQRGV
jgi:hypothetical protein